jgi:RNA polymerase sigma-70 factor (ECF subfamily)
MMSDGGGVKQALLQPIKGANRVARVLGLGLPRIVGEVSVEPVQINGGPALIIRIDDEIDSVVAARIDDGRITGLYIVRNPEKLSHVQQETRLTTSSSG